MLKLEQKEIVGCIVNNDIHRLEALLKSGVSPNFRDLGDTPLHIASRSYPNIAAVQLLLQYGAEVDMLNRSKETALYDCINQWFEATATQIEILEVLLKNGADPNFKKSKTGDSLLYTAIVRKHYGAVEVLLEYGADSNENVNSLKVTPIMWPANLEILKMLLKYNANVNLRDKWERNVAYIYASNSEDLDKEMKMFQIVLEQSILTDEDVIMIIEDMISYQREQAFLVFYKAGFIRRHLIEELIGIAKHYEEEFFINFLNDL